MPAYGGGAAREAATARVQSFQAKNNAFGPKPEGPKQLAIPSYRQKGSRPGYVIKGEEKRPALDYGRRNEARSRSGVYYGRDTYGTKNSGGQLNRGEQRA